MVKLNVPAKSGSAHRRHRPPAGRLPGRRVRLLRLTRGATVRVNTGALAVLGLVESITDDQPTSLKGNVAVWGPYTDALSPTTWKLTVTKTAANTYSYKLEGKAKAAADSAFKVVLSGTHAVGATQRTPAPAASCSTGTRRRRCPSTTTTWAPRASDYSRRRRGQGDGGRHFRQVKDGFSSNR